MRTGRCEGDLPHKGSDSLQVAVASCWPTQRSKSGRPLGTLVTTNDISERKRAKDPLRRS
ncbi:hypothetical protein AYM40_29590 [Paraburkholderia phytofirmans OLGA172]|uniref:PAC domain-containing protein n=1 Tax=Paraburkholderia phytofirmans OLGA172 TaxID=1417228 RepID=A0A160FTA4_9BURK|nr:hypothetical protein AYM40_29590 [Paraburkholderia phytofirmans OLGA172]